MLKLFSLFKLLKLIKIFYLENFYLNYSTLLLFLV